MAFSWFEEMARGVFDLCGHKRCHCPHARILGGEMPGGDDATRLNGDVVADLAGYEHVSIDIERSSEFVIRRSAHDRHSVDFGVGVAVRQ